MLHIKKLEGKDIYSFTIDGKIDTEGMEKLSEILEESKKTGKIKLLGEMNKMPGFEDFSSVTETMKMKFKAMNAIGKYAVLSDKNWIEKLIPIGDFLTPGLPIKHFKAEDRDNAIAWLEEE